MKILMLSRPLNHRGQAKDDLAKKKKPLKTPEEQSEILKETVDSETGQLWEECFDLSEALIKLRSIVARNFRFWSECRKEQEDLEENWSRFFRLGKGISDDLAKVSIDEIVFGLQAVFARSDAEKISDDAKVEDIPYYRYLEVTREMRNIAGGLLAQSFDFFLHSCEMYPTLDGEWIAEIDVRREQLIDESSMVWSDIFEVFAHLEALTKRLKQFSCSQPNAPYSVDSDVSGAAANLQEVLAILSLAHNIVRRKVLENKDGNLQLIKKFKELYVELRKDLQESLENVLPTQVVSQETSVSALKTILE